MDYREIVKHQLRVDEGEKLRPYQCTAGKLTIGVGHNLDDKPIPKAVSDLLLDYDVADAEQDARRLFLNFDSLSPTRKAVVINMAFNLGLTRLSKFLRFIQAVNEHRFDDAAVEMMDSKWAIDVGARATRLAHEMRAG